MKAELIDILENFGYPVRLQGSLGEAEQYPAAFFTIWNGATDGEAHYDNSATVTVWAFDVNFYATDPQLVNTQLEAAIHRLRENGWIISGKGSDVASDEPTHTGRGVTVYFIEREAKTYGNP